MSSEFFPQQPKQNFTIYVYEILEAKKVEYSKKIYKHAK